MDERLFNGVWETEYLCARVKNISEAVKNGNYESALDMLLMIQDKASAAAAAIIAEKCK